MKIKLHNQIASYFPKKGSWFALDRFLLRRDLLDSIKIADFKYRYSVIYNLEDCSLREFEVYAYDMDTFSKIAMEILRKRIILEERTLT